MPGVSQADLTRVAERLRETIARSALPLGGQRLSFSISAAVAAAAGGDNAAALDFAAPKRPWPQPCKAGGTGPCAATPLPGTLHKMVAAEGRASVPSPSGRGQGAGIGGHRCESPHP